MMNPKGKPVLNEGLMLESAAYLAMWKALEAFDPKADRWAEPISFGSSEDRSQVAEEALRKLEGRELDARTVEDIERFHTLLGLVNGPDQPFSESAAKFAEYLRDRGSELARQSVSHASGATNR